MGTLSFHSQFNILHVKTIEKKLGYLVMQGKIQLFNALIFFFFKNSFNLIKFFFNFWLCWVFIAVQAFLQFQRAGAALQFWCAGFSLQWLSCCRAWAGGCPGFSSCGMQAQLLCGVWNLSRPGIEPMSPALAGVFFNTEPPGKPSKFFSIFPKCVFCALKFMRDT